MTLNRFRLRIILQSILIAITGYFTVSIIFSGDLWLTQISLFLFWLFLLVNLINYISRTNTMLQSFLESLKYQDNIASKDDGDPSLKALNQSFNSIIDKIKEAEAAVEAQSIYLKNIVEHINTGLISYDHSGKIKLINKAAKSLLNQNLITNIDKLSTLKKNLATELKNLPPGDSHLSTLILRGELHKIIFRKARMKILGEELTIISLQDIRNQLEEEELDTWKKLISILRHEIMNSVTPLNSLSLSLQKILNKNKDDLPGEDYGMLMEGMEAISRRSKGLMNFVQAYRTLTSIPKPRFTEFPVSRLINQSICLFEPQLKKKNITYSVYMDESLNISADFDLISQILINLIKNAMEAIDSGEGKISLEASKTKDGYTILSVKDNGKGIKEEDRGKIFLPFYTTKEEGSGIGLSLTREIIRMHKGQIDLNSQPGKGTTFTIKF